MVLLQRMMGTGDKMLLLGVFSGEAQGGVMVMWMTMTLHDVVIRHCQDGSRFLRTLFAAALDDGQVG